MEKREAVRCFNEGKRFVETCLEQIASLEQSNDKELRQALMGTYMVKIYNKATDNFVKVCGYVINGEDGAQKMKGKLYDLKEKIRQLYNSADKQNLIPIREISDVILKEIGEVEEWANDDEGDIPPVIPKSGEDDINRLPPDMIGIFKTFDEYKTFIEDCESLHKPKQIVGRLMDFNISLDYGNTDIIHKHLKKKGIINVSYSHFCRLIREENGA